MNKIYAMTAIGLILIACDATQTSPQKDTCGAGALQNLIGTKMNGFDAPKNYDPVMYAGITEDSYLDLVDTVYADVPVVVVDREVVNSEADMKGATVLRIYCGTAVRDE